MTGPTPFARLGDAVEFLATSLERGEFDAIADRCADSAMDDAVAPRGLPSPRAYRLAALRVLASRHAERNLRTLYRGREFPNDRSELKLGGHEKELGHIHVDFERNDAGWVLKDVWICR